MIKILSKKKNPKVVLNGFNKNGYTVEEVLDLLVDLGIPTAIDTEFDFSKVGKHYVVNKGK